jgi:hypothetical protein
LALEEYVDLKSYELVVTCGTRWRILLTCRHIGIQE